MDFFQAQRSAHRRTGLLVALFAAAVAAIVAANYVAFHVSMVVSAENGGASFQPFPNPTLLAAVAAITVVVILSGTAYRTASLRRGGPAVAELAGGRPVEPDTDDPAERRLLNVVEEMAIASGVPVPAVYVLDEEGINAFAAGRTIHDAAVAVTRGALERLDRDELQGVMAHEFSHLLNGDMRLNVRLIGMLYGILLIAVIGRKMLQGRRYSSSRKRGGGSSALFALALIVIGYIGVLFGRIIKAAISRQREFLADASAVQFTRNPEGIAGALKKIGAHAAGSRVRDAEAEELSHLFFANALGRNLFATHPPLVERIRRIDPPFDGEFPALEPVPAAAAVAADAGDVGQRTGASMAAFAGDAGPPADAGPGPGAAAGDAGDAPVPAQADELMSSIGTPTAAHVSHAASLLESIPPELDAAARTPGGAQALVLALVLHPDHVGGASDRGDAHGANRAPAVRQRGVVRRHGGDSLLAWVDDLAPRVRARPREARLALLDLALPALGRLPPATAADFRAAIHELVRADDRVRVFEYALVNVLKRHLREDGDGATRQRGRTLRSLAPVREHVRLALSAVARSGARDEAEIRAAFRVGAASLAATVGELRLRDAADVGLASVDRALDELCHGTLEVRRRFLEACARCVAHDGRVRPSEVAILRAIAEGLDCPMPPLVVGEEGASRPEVAAG